MTATNPNASPPQAVDAGAADRHGNFETLPTLYRDRSFWGMTVTQFLGAFNDSVFKQIVLLLCATVIMAGSSQSSDRQFLGLAIFSIAFVLFSGISGYWSDRVSKRSIIVGCKFAEIAVMALAVVAFATMAPRIPEGNKFLTSGVPWLVLGVLFLMGTQSAIFGPAKYGILPEMVRPDDLPRFNGMIQMTTFLALIFGTYFGGYLLEVFGSELWKAGLVCVVIAAVGTGTSFLVRRTGVAQRGAPFQISAVAVAPDTLQVLREDRPLRMALWVYSIFWFVASIIPMAVNTLGLKTFGLNYAETSFLLTTVSVGIAAGFVLAGKLSAGQVKFGLVRIGTWGLIVTLLLMSLPQSFRPAVVDEAGTTMWAHLLGRFGSYVALAAMGFFAGLFALPVQVFLQARPPERLKGRVIGTMNLINWIAIIIAAGLYMLSNALLSAMALPNFGIFAITALILLPIALFYRPRDTALKGMA